MNPDEFEKALRALIKASEKLETYVDYINQTEAAKELLPIADYIEGGRYLAALEELRRARRKGLIPNGEKVQDDGKGSDK